MARRQTEAIETDEDEAPKKKRALGLPLWLEEAWEGWLKSLSVLFVAVIAYVLYSTGLLGERAAGVGAVLAVVLGAAASTVPASWGMLAFKKPAVKSLFLTFVGVWVVATGWPSLRAALPPAPLGEAKLTAAEPRVTLKVDGAGPYEAMVSARFKQQGPGDAEASYRIEVEGGGGHDEMAGTLNRSLMRFRAGRRGGTSTALAEHTAETHRLANVRGGELTFTIDGIDEQLDGAVTIDVRKAAPSPLLFLVLGALACLVALGFDARLVDSRGKVKSYLTSACALCVVFALRFPDEATPHSLVRPAVSAVVFAGLTGGLGGWLLGAIARLMFGPKLGKTRR